MNEQQRRRLYKALGEIEASLFADTDLELRLTEDPKTLLMKALQEMGTLVTYMGLDEPHDINGTDCRAYAWKNVAVLAVCAIASVREAQEQEPT